MTAGPMVQPYPIFESTPTLEQIHRRLNAENIDLRGQLELARKATSAAQELLEAERQKSARLEAQVAAAWNGYLRADWQGDQIEKAQSALDTEKLLRTNDAATIADLERRLREAEGQLKAQRYSVSANVAAISGRASLMGPAIGMMEIPAVLWRERMAENAELRRTIDLMAKTAAEAQDNFRLIAELAADPADEKRKENTK